MEVAADYIGGNLGGLVVDPDPYEEWWRFVKMTMRYKCGFSLSPETLAETEKSYSICRTLG